MIQRLIGVEFERREAKLGEKQAVLVFAGIVGGQQCVANKNGIGPGEKAQSLHFIGHFRAPR
jgi:hypothetical protein